MRLLSLLLLAVTIPLFTGASATESESATSSCHDDETIEEFLRNIRIYHQMKRYEDAREEAMAAHDFCPEAIMPVLLLSKVLHDMGELSEAKRFLMRVLEGEPAELRSEVVKFIADIDYEYGRISFVVKGRSGLLEQYDVRLILTQVVEGTTSERNMLDYLEENLVYTSADPSEIPVYYVPDGMLKAQLWIADDKFSCGSGYEKGEYGVLIGEQEWYSDAGEYRTIVIEYSCARKKLLELVLMLFAWALVR